MFEIVIYPTEVGFSKEGRAECVRHMKNIARMYRRILSAADSKPATQSMKSQHHVKQRIQDQNPREEYNRVATAMRSLGLRRERRDQGQPSVRGDAHTYSRNPVY